MKPGDFKKADSPTLRKFGLVMAIPLTIIAAILFWKGRGIAPYFLTLSALFAFCGFAIPFILKPIYVLWMTMAFYLGTGMTYVILTVFFVLVLTPAGLLMRLVGKDLLSRKFPGNQRSYWLPAQEYPDDLERYSKPF